MKRRPPRVERLRNLTLSQPPRPHWSDNLGYVILWTAVGTLLLCIIVLIST